MNSNTWYRSKAEQNQQLVLKYSQLEGDQWTSCKKTKGFEVFRMNALSEDTAGYIFKGEGRIDLCYRDLWALLVPEKEWHRRLAWDHGLASIKTADTVKAGEELTITYSTTHTALYGLVSPRDFVDLLLTVDDEDTNTIYSASSSIPHPDYPDPMPGYARGTNFLCGYISAQSDHDPSSSKLVMIMHVDAGGSLPRSVTDMAVPITQIQMYHNLKKHVEKLKKKGK